MTQPTWITPAGSLGIIPEGIFYRIPVVAIAGTEDVLFVLIAGQLPAGIQVTPEGAVEGVPKNIIDVQGVPTEVSRDVTSQFAIRAYTRKVVNGVLVVDRLADRTFSLTVTGQDVPDFVTPAGNVGTYYDGTSVTIDIAFTDPDPNDNVTIRLLTGQLPPGLVLDPKTGEISGVIEPLVGPPGTAAPGYDSTPKDIYPNDFTTRSASQNFQFTLEITDGKNSNARTFTIYVYSKDSMSADAESVIMVESGPPPVYDNTPLSADNTFITADVVPTRTPVLLTPTGDLGRIRADNYYAKQFTAVDFDGDAVEFVLSAVGYDPLPPGLSLDPDTGWFYGYIPDQGATEAVYDFAIRVFKRDYPTVISEYYYFSMSIVGDIDTEVTWLTAPDLGTIDNGSVSLFEVKAVNIGGRLLQYRLVSGSNSRLPQGLTLLPSGHIAGYVSYNTFALDGGTTTFDGTREIRLQGAPTTFDMLFEFDVNAYAPVTQALGYQLSSINITTGGTGFTSQPTITISAPSQLGGIQATAGVATITGGAITAIALGNPGSGYTVTPTVTITGGGGAGATATATIEEIELLNAVSVVRRFSITVNRAYNEPADNLYIKCMPPLADRALISSLLQNQDIIPQSTLFRPDDFNFGIATNVIYVHAYGLTPATLDAYVASLYINHYRKNLTLGEIKTAQALDSAGNVIYEVIYSEIIDNLVNNQGESVSKQVTLPYPVNAGDSTEISIVYPNSLINMRDQVVDTVGKVSQTLPLWMTSRQVNGQVLGFIPAWVIAYTNPGESGRIKYNIQQQFGEQLNKVDYQVDRYELGRGQSYLWDSETSEWIPTPPESTIFDQTTTIFDYNSVTFVTPADDPTGTDVFDKYLMFPRTNILG
jgi:hypothetical protein